jgi:hypothetical protein
MSVTQLSIFLENKIGRLLEVTGILKDAGIDIKAISLSDNVDYGIFRMIVSDPEKAYGLFHEKNIICKKNEVIAVIIPHRPGGLHDLLGKLISNKINVEYMYVTSHTDPERVVMILSVDKVSDAIRALDAAGIKRARIEDIK